MTPQQLNKCLQKFYLSARRRDGTFYNKKSLTAIRAALDRHLRSPPLNKPFSIIGDPLFTEANKTLSNYLKTLSKRGDIAPTAHKQALTKEVIEKLYDEGELVSATATLAGTCEINLMVQCIGCLLCSVAEMNFFRVYRASSKHSKNWES